MNDPTRSRYRFLKIRNIKNYGRFALLGSKNIKSTDSDIEENDIPAHGTYSYLLFKPEWKARRKEILIKDSNKCVICKSDKFLQVHHRQYHFIVLEKKFKLPWEYSDHLLITLCESCHSRGHSKFKVPTINI